MSAFAERKPTLFRLSVPQRRRVLLEKRRKLALTEVLHQLEPQADHIAVGVVGVELAVAGEAGDAAEGEAAFWTVERQVDRLRPLGVNHRPGLALAGHEEVDDLLVVPEELRARSGRRQ